MERFFVRDTPVGGVYIIIVAIIEGSADSACWHKNHSLPTPQIAGRWRAYSLDKSMACGYLSGLTTETATTDKGDIQ